MSEQKTVDRTIYVLFHSEVKIFERTDTSLKTGIPYETGVSLVYFSDDEFNNYAKTYETCIKKDGHELRKFVVAPIEAIIDILMLQKETFNEPNYITMRTHLWKELGKLIAEGNEDAIRKAVRWGADTHEDIIKTEIDAEFGDVVEIIDPQQHISTKRRRYLDLDRFPTKGYYFGEQFKYQAPEPVEEPEPVIEEKEEFIPYEEEPYVFIPSKTKDEIDLDELETACQSYIRAVIPTMKNIGKNFSDMEFNPMEMLRVRYHSDIADALGIDRSEEALKDILHELEKSVKLPIRDYESDSQQEITFYAFEYGGKLADLLLYKLTKKH